jgi:hypothetical protein
MFGYTTGAFMPLEMHNCLMTKPRKKPKLNYVLKPTVFIYVEAIKRYQKMTCFNRDLSIGNLLRDQNSSNSSASSNFLVKIGVTISSSSILAGALGFIERWPLATIPIDKFRFKWYCILLLLSLGACKNKFQENKSDWMEHEYFCNKESLCEVFLSDRESMKLLQDPEAKQFFIDRLAPQYFRNKENISEEFQTLGYLYYISSPTFNVDSLLQVKGGYRVLTSLLYNEVIPVDFISPCSNLLFGTKTLSYNMKVPANPIIPLAKYGYYENQKFRFGLMNQAMAQKYSDYILSHLNEVDTCDLDMHIFLHANIGWPMSNEQFNRLSNKLLELHPERKNAVEQVRKIRNSINTYCLSTPDTTFRFYNSKSTSGNSYFLFLQKMMNLCGAKFTPEGGTMPLDFEVTTYEMHRASMLDTKRIPTKKTVSSGNRTQTITEEQVEITHNGHEIISNNIIYLRFQNDTLLLPYYLNKPIDATQKDYTVTFFRDECWLMGISKRMFDIWISESEKDYSN